MLKVVWLGEWVLGHQSMCDLQLFNGCRIINEKISKNNDIYYGLWLLFYLGINPQVKEERLMFGY